MIEDDESVPDPMTVLPPGTSVDLCQEAREVVLAFPTEDDAIVFHEFLRAFANGEIELEVVKR